jgi:ubiquinone biosynthesis protein COQ4
LQPIKAIKAITRLVRNPTHTHEVFIIIRALSGSDLQKGLNRFRTTEVGRSVLKDRTQLMNSLRNKTLLAELPQKSLGQRYLQFINEQGLSADGLVEASEEQADALDADSDLALFATRQRDMHDLWHVLTEYGRDELGEACLLGFTYAQNKNRGVGFIAFVGCFKLYRRHGLSAARSIFNAYLDGRRAAWLPQQDWETLLHEPIESVRKKLKIGSPVLYQRCRGSYLIGS